MKLEESPEALDRKQLERTRGFLNYVCQTYKPFLPYLNGLHMTIDGFRGNRDKEGWKLPKKSGPSQRRMMRAPARQLPLWTMIGTIGARKWRS